MQQKICIVWLNLHSRTVWKLQQKIVIPFHKYGHYNNGKKKINKKQ